MRFVQDVVAAQGEQLITEKTGEQVYCQIAVPVSVVPVLIVQDPAGEQQQPVAVRVGGCAHLSLYEPLLQLLDLAHDLSLHGINSALLLLPRSLHS